MPEMDDDWVIIETPQAPKPPVPPRPSADVIAKLFEYSNKNKN